MQKRHDESLTSRLEAVLDSGVVLILWAELYRWYDVKKIAVKTYRDLEARWAEIKTSCDTDPGNLMCVDGPGGLWLFSDKSLRSIKNLGNKAE